MQDFGNIIQRPDGSFVIDYNGLPYHVLDNAEFHDLYLQVLEYAQANPDMVGEEEQPVFEQEEITETPPISSSERLYMIESQIAKLQGELELIRNETQPTELLLGGE